MDLAIALDSSDTENEQNWQTLLEFSAAFLDAFTISAHRTHVGLIVFSTHADVPLYFNTLREENLTTEGVKKIIYGLKPKGGVIRLDRALLGAEEELFSEENGMRIELPKV